MVGPGISRVLSPFRGGAHVSGTFLTEGLLRPTRGYWPGQPTPYLALLRTGFAVPPFLRRVRWALTPPFHPYPAERGGLFSVALSLGLRRPGVTRCPALWSPDFPQLTSRELRAPSGADNLSVYSFTSPSSSLFRDSAKARSLSHSSSSL